MSPAVRNIRGIGNIKPIPVSVFIPPLFSPVWKIEVVTDSGTIDLTELIVEGFYLDGVTNTIGDFEFKILDPDNENNELINEFDTINVYLDYGEEATTLRFVGKIERKSLQEQVYLNLSGRSVGMITTGTNITYSSNGYKARSEILKEIINMKKADGTTPKYFGGVISDSGVEDDLTEIEVNYEETPFWDIIEELCSGGGRDAYLDKDLVFNYFIKGSRTNASEAVVQNINLISTSDYAKDTREVYTKVRVYGKSIGESIVIATSTPDTSNTNGIIKELKIDNSSINSVEQALQLANSEATDRKIPPTIGSITSLLLPTLLPGEKVRITNPTNGILPDAYQINSFKHIFSKEDSPKTELIIQKRKVELSTILKSNIKFQNSLPDNRNKYDMDFSKVVTFDVDSGTHTNTVVNTTDGYLKVVPGNNSGVWISDLINLEGDVTAIECRLTGENLRTQYTATTSNVWFSLDGGITFYPYIPSTTTVTTGSKLKIKIDLNSADAQASSVSVLYKIY